jgi:hypothetical protein
MQSLGEAKESLREAKEWLNEARPPRRENELGIWKFFLPHYSPPKRRAVTGEPTPVPKTVRLFPLVA